jgi:hypothetical protein
VYDKVSWGILFETMLKMGMAIKEFVEMVKLFLKRLRLWYVQMDMPHHKAIQNKNGCEAKMSSNTLPFFILVGKC